MYKREQLVCHVTRPVMNGSVRFNWRPISGISIYPPAKHQFDLMRVERLFGVAASWEKSVMSVNHAGGGGGGGSGGGLPVLVNH